MVGNLAVRFPNRRLLWDGAKMEVTNDNEANALVRRPCRVVLLRLFRVLGDRVHLVHFKDLKLNAATGSVDFPGAGAGKMDYPSFIAEIRKLRRPVACIIEHIPAEPAVMQNIKAFIEAQLRKAS